MATDVTAARPTGRHESGGLHWAHWVVVIASLALTLIASWITAENAEERQRDEFDRQASRAIDHLLERMEKYEGGLWAGVGVIDSFNRRGQNLERLDWVTFAESIDLVGRYPGINGIGVIYHVSQGGLDEYVARYRSEYPELAFDHHPEVDVEHHFPITFLEPVAGNEAALGLDMAFETERRDGAMRAMTTGKAQITGPIVLVQDEGKTPGFLFFAPFYDHEHAKTLDSFQGMVYAPFVVKRLVTGALERGNRSVALIVRDGDTVLYDESAAVIDPEHPRFSVQRSVDLYGRTWEFDCQSIEPLGGMLSNAQAATIMACGLTIDTLLFTVFVLLTRSRRRAERFAEEKTRELRETVHELEQSNVDLEQFAFIASHDLQTPMRTVGNFAQVLKEDLSGRINEDEEYVLDTMIRATSRMKAMVTSVLEYSRIDGAAPPDEVDLERLLQDLIWELGEEIAVSVAEVEHGVLPTLHVPVESASLLFRNLLSNALKFRRPDVHPRVRFDAERTDRGWRITCTDNGIGVEPEHREKVFEVFKRLHRESEYSGSGIGLSICRKVVCGLGGTIRIEDAPGGGARFVIELPDSATCASDRRDPAIQQA